MEKCGKFESRDSYHFIIFPDLLRIYYHPLLKFKADNKIKSMCGIRTPLIFKDTTGSEPLSRFHRYGVNKGGLNGIECDGNMTEVGGWSHVTGKPVRAFYSPRSNESPTASIFSLA